VAAKVRTFLWRTRERGHCTKIIEYLALVATSEFRNLCCEQNNHNADNQAMYGPTSRGSLSRGLLYLCLLLYAQPVRHRKQCIIPYVIPSHMAINQLLDGKIATLNFFHPERGIVVKISIPSDVCSLLLLQ
jgi:hypothetical protein